MLLAKIVRIKVDLPVDLPLLLQKKIYLYFLKSARLLSLIFFLN